MTDLLSSVRRNITSFLLYFLPCLILFVLITFSLTNGFELEWLYSAFFTKSLHNELLLFFLFLWFVPLIAHVIIWWVVSRIRQGDGQRRVRILSFVFWPLAAIVLLFVISWNFYLVKTAGDRNAQFSVTGFDKITYDQLPEEIKGGPEEARGKAYLRFSFIKSSNATGQLTLECELSEVINGSSQSLPQTSSVAFSSDTAQLIFSNFSHTEATSNYEASYKLLCPEYNVDDYSYPVTGVEYTTPTYSINEFLSTARMDIMKAGLDAPKISSFLDSLVNQKLLANYPDYTVTKFEYATSLPGSNNSSVRTPYTGLLLMKSTAEQASPKYEIKGSIFDPNASEYWGGEKYKSIKKVELRGRSAAILCESESTSNCLLTWQEGDYFVLITATGPRPTIKKEREAPIALLSEFFTNIIKSLP